MNLCMFIRVMLDHESESEEKARHSIEVREREEEKGALAPHVNEICSCRVRERRGERE